MKRTILVWIIVLLTALASLGVLDCRCAFAACTGTSAAKAASVPPCHQQGSDSPQNSSSGEKCCGHCQSVSTAIPTEKIDLPSSVRSSEILNTVPRYLFSKPALENPNPTAILGLGGGSNFFIQNVLTATYSLHAPPLS
jgi:hypothetical protein